MPSGEKANEDPLESCSSEELKSELKYDFSSARPKLVPAPTTEVKEAMGKSPGEIKFFKLLHAELKKAVYFFERAEEEFIIREARVREGMEILKNTNTTMIATSTASRWSRIAKSFYRLYKDLLLLETFAIMTYCSFSKILKKHDKVTGYNTRCAFMNNVVNKANFAHYPRTLEMIHRTQVHCEEATDVLSSEGRSDLYEDERLFINMIHQLNEQVISSEHATADTSNNTDTERLQDKQEKFSDHKHEALLHSNQQHTETEKPAQLEEHGRKRQATTYNHNPRTAQDDQIIASESKKVKYPDNC